MPSEILKVKVDDAWVGVTAIKGEKGDEGDPGNTITFGANKAIVVETATGTVVEANPATTTGTLTGIKIGDTGYAVPTPTAVEANPATTTGTLTGIKIGDTGYAVSGGSSSSLYRHTLVVSNVNNRTGSIFITILSRSSSAINTIALIKQNANKIVSVNGLAANSEYFYLAFGWYVRDNIFYVSAFRLQEYPTSDGYIIERLNPYPHWEGVAIESAAQISDTVEEI